MKKNDFGTFVAYVGMFAIAVLVGLLVVRPAIVNNQATLGMPAILLIGLSIVAGIIINALLLEQGHVVGAKAGGYTIYGFAILGLKWTKGKDGKWKGGVGSFEGLTGETKIYPNDTKTSSMSAYTAFPLLAFLVEVVVCVVLISIGKSKIHWLYIFATIVLAIGGMIYLYNYLPAALDVETDGYRMTILNKAVNREAYNDLLLDRYNVSRGMKTTSKVYEDVTEFTSNINLIKVYEKLAAQDFPGAIMLLQKTLDTPNHISSSTRNFATTLKLSIVILTTRREDGKTFYSTIDDTYRHYIMELNDSVSLRTFVLIQGVLEGNQEETNFALEKAEKLLKKCPDYAAETEMKLFELGLTRIKTLHPTWKLTEPNAKKEEDIKETTK